MTHVGRRALLRGGAAAAVTLGAGVGCRARSSDDGSGVGAPPPRLVAFRGEHQAAVTEVSAVAGIVAGLDVTVDDRAALVDLLRTVSAEVEHVMSGETYERRAGGFPPLDTGVLGPEPGPTGTAVLLGVGASLFDDRFGLAGHRPRELRPMPRFRNDRLVTPERSHGDLSLVVQAATPDAATHALRQILRRTRGELRLRWMRQGHNVIDHDAGPGQAHGRNLMGFKDGTVNPDVGRPADLDEFVWIGPDDGEPAWAVGGSYQAIRVIRMLVEFWDRTRLSEQEAIFGRHRDTGAPLGMAHETDTPVFAGDFSSHIARANPRRDGDPRFTMLRRPFTYVGDVDENGQLDQGLLFVSYQRSLSTGFVGVQERLDGERLEEYIRPLGGGLFVVLPGPGADGYLGQQLVG